ncbi:MAG: hypothetical protein GY731_14895 [Gammaproteobacteria bacterium]|nr:hypothetical protein [Gammaproteobacteria bacterium]
MKKLTITAMTACILAAGPLVANADISANVGFVTDYLFRGISQTDNSPAIQGGFDYNHDSGFYVGIWGSSIDFADGLEADYYAGFSSEFSNGLGWDAGVIYYDYPGDHDTGGLENDYAEIYGSLSYDFGPAAVTGAVNYSGDYFADSDDAVYYALGVDVPLPWELGLSLHVGHQDIDNNTNFGTPDYTDWSIGLGRSYSGFDFGLTYSDTNLSKRECFGGGNTCDGTVVFSVAKSF